VLLQLIYGTVTWQPIRNSNVALRNLKIVYLRKEENTQVTTLSFLGTKQIFAPTVLRTSNMYRYGNNEDLSTAAKLSLTTVTSHAEHGGPSDCVCNMAVHLMDSDCRHMVSQSGHSDFSATIQQSGKPFKLRARFVFAELRARFVFAEVQLKTPFIHHMTLRQ
jgi:hypothetical protein